LTDNKTMSAQDIDDRFEAAFPAPSPRENQDAVIREAVQAFEDDDCDVVMVDAPPGFGKSITLYTILKMLGGKSYYATPLKSLQDQLTEDDFIGDKIQQIKGRNNYPCILPEADSDTTVDVAKCQRDSDFDCEIKQSCPYYAQKARAVGSDCAVVNLSYLMSVPVTPDPDDGNFSKRDRVIVDECQGIEDWAINFIGFTISKRTIPRDVWKNLDWPRSRRWDDYDVMIDFVENEVLPKAKEMKQYLSAQPMLGEGELKEQERLDDFIQKVERFLGDEEDHHWTVSDESEVKKNQPNDKKVKFEPINVGRFLDGLVWSKADKVILSSATIPKQGWLDEIGLGDKKVKRLNIPSPFPIENRPIVTSEAVGKMTYKKKGETIGPMVRKIKQIAEHHSGEKGIVHCRGYNYIEMFKRACYNNGLRGWFKENVAIQDRDNREGSLEHWVTGDKQIFLSVNMAEGIDLKGDKCRWQVLLKTKYPAMNDERVSYRIDEMGDWDWYNRKAVIQLEQAYGRAVRSKDDEAVFYILDKSAVGLIKRNKGMFHDWFLEAIQEGI